MLDINQAVSNAEWFKMYSWDVYHGCFYILVDDACSSAKLAHSLFFSSVSADKLKTLYPTLAALPQVCIALDLSDVSPRSTAFLITNIIHTCPRNLIGSVYTTNVKCISSKK